MKNFLFFLTITIYVFTGLFAGTYSGGNGSEATPYQIADLDDLEELQNTSSDWGDYFIQTADIDAAATSGWDNGAGFNPIGGSTTQFTGNYDGQDYNIENLTINRDDKYFIGFFGYTISATIENLGVINVDINGEVHVGGLVGRNDGSSSISNCYTTGNVNGIGQNVGGLLGMNNDNSIVSNCYSTAVVSGDDDVGGLIGDNDESSSVSNCYSTGNVSGIDGIGGLIGENDVESSVSICYSTGDVSGDDYIGGLVGVNMDGTITQSYATGFVTGDHDIGGLIGFNDFNTNESAIISECYATGNVTSTISGSNDRIGGFIGDSQIPVINCYCKGNVTTDDSPQGYIAAFIGQNRSNVTNSYSIGDVINSSTSDPADAGFVITESGYSPTYSNNFWDSETSNQTTGTGATGKTTIEMNTLTTFTDAGWDFRGETVNGTDDIWNIGHGRNDGYPYFDWQYPGDDDPPTTVTLSSFTAVYVNGSSILKWTTQSETNNMGWNIYRSETKLVDGVQINNQLISGAGTSTQPSEYEFYDEQELMANNTYWYWLESVDYSGKTELYSPVSLTIPEQDDDPEIPEMIITNIINYPNPFSNATIISFDVTIENTENIEISIYNMKGQLIRIIPVTWSETGGLTSWDGKDENGINVGSGIYTYLIKTGSEQYSGKMIRSK